MHITLSDTAMDTPTPTKQRGRPPAFNHEEALEKAMHVFWAHGYEGASMSDLTEALGVNKPSIYGAFGSKEELFRKTLQRYVQGPAAFVGAFMLLFLWQGGNFFRRNRPGFYRPEALPAELLPKR